MLSTLKPKKNLILIFTRKVISEFFSFPSTKTEKSKKKQKAFLALQD